DMRLVKSFWEAVEQLLPDEDERNRFHSMLREYRSSLDLERLLREMRRFVNSPRRIPLYEAVRPLIPLRHQIAYDARALRPPSDRPALVQLQRSGAASSAFGEPEPYGFSVRGGAEHGIGFYVTYVRPRSHAWEQGLMPGDELVRVNGFRIDRAISAELADLVRSRNDLSLRVRRVGLIPRRIVPDDPLSWEHISPELLNTHRDTVRVFLNVRDAGGVGCSVASDGPPDRPNGVFIRSVKVGSPAEQVGLEVGDELLEANGQRLSGLPHSATVVALKASPHLLLTVRKARPLPDYPTDEDSALASSAAAAASVSPIYEEGSSGYAELNSASSPTGGRGSGGGGGGVSSVVGGGSTVTIDLHKSPPPGGRVTRGEFQLERPHPATAARHGDTFEEQEITTYF
ncbi:hypothetical protein BOX15_Mlig024614g3, partial [Macrostomum lignano]